MNWREVERLFDAAADRPASERAEWVRQNCDDADVVRETLSLLESAEASEDFLDPDVEAGPAVMPEGRRFGPWRVEGLLGSGGMGEVYVVARADGEFRQSAALKLMRPLPRAYWTRFQTERQILAELEHPGVARLLDGGISDDGRPYMVLEHVQGSAIDVWSATRTLDAAARVRLVLEVAETVSHAHARLVLHRDLKPSNILVDETGRTRLIDFGVATVLATDGAVTETPLSMEYAAPEMLQGRSASTATDVYGLAGVLYELLTGRPPIGVSGQPIATAVRRVLEQEPQRLSAAPTAIPISRDLRGDLDAILAKALRREAQDRYPTVDAFAADLRRALAREPIEARRGEKGYALGRFLRRRRWPITAAAAIAISLCGGLAMSLWQAEQARRERDTAVREQARLEAVQQYMYFMLRGASEAGGPNADTGRILDTAAQRVQALFERDPARGGPVMHTLGELFFYLDDYEAAEPLLRRLSEAKGVEPHLAASAAYDLAQVRLRQADVEEAARLLARAQAFWRADETRWRSRLVDSRLVEARLLRDQGEVEKAVDLLRANLPVRIAISGANHRETGVYHNDLGVMLVAAGDREAAIPSFQAAMAVWAATGLDSGPDALNTLNNLAALHVLGGRPAQAEPLFRRAVEVRRSLYGRSAATAALLSNHGKTLIQLQRPKEAETLLREAVAMARETAGAGSLHFASSSSGLSEVLLLLNRSEEAAAVAQSALVEVTQELGPRHPAVAVLKAALGRVRGAQGRRDEADRLLSEAEAGLAPLGPAGAAQLEAIRKIRSLYGLPQG